MNPLVTLVPPLAVVPLILILGERRRNAREACIIVAGTAVPGGERRGLPRDARGGARRRAASWTMLPGLSLSLSAEPMGVMFALLASFLWVVTTIYSIGYMRGHHEKNQTRFYTCFAIAIAAVMGAAYAADLLTLFVAYEVLSVSTYPLVTHPGTEAARRAGRVYVGILIGASIAFFVPAIVWTASVAGTLDFVPGGVLGGAGLSAGALGVLLALFTFGIAKAAVMPLHRWLPAAMVAPTPVSALLHAVAVVKTGVFALLKVVTYTFGIDTVGAAGAADWLLPIAAFTMLAASCVAFTKDNLKARLAYSTISQLSYIVMAALLATSMSVTGGAAHIVMHAFGKITLFFCAGAIMVAAHKHEDLRARRARPAHAVDDGGVRDRGGGHHRAAADGRDLEQAADRGRLVRHRHRGLVAGADALDAAEHRLPAADPAARVPARRPRRREGAPSPREEAPTACLLALGLTATVTVLLFVFPGAAVRAAGADPMALTPGSPRRSAGSR